MKGESSSMCIAFSILMLGYNIILSVGIHVVCQDLGQQNPGGIHGGIPTRIMDCPKVGSQVGFYPGLAGSQPGLWLASGGIPPGIPPKIGGIPGGIPPEAFHNPGLDPTWD